LLGSMEGIAKLFGGVGDVLFAAIVDGGKIAADLMVNALTGNKTPIPFIMQANAQNALLPNAVKRLRDTISKGAGSAGADPAILAEINALPKIMSQNATGVVGAAGDSGLIMPEMREVRGGVKGFNVRGGGIPSKAIPGSVRFRSPKARMLDRISSGAGSEPRTLKDGQSDARALKVDVTNADEIGGLA